MEFVLILICIGVQRYLNVKSLSYRRDWLDKYYAWFVGRFSPISAMRGYARVFSLILPVMLVFSVLLALVYHLFGVFMYWILSGVLLWYAMDASELCLNESELNIDEQLISKYRGLFALIFWFVLIGPVGVVLYACAIQMHVQFSEPNDTSSFQLALEHMLGLLDWLPVKLLGITFALVGNFSSVFAQWLKDLLAGFVHVPQQLVGLAYRAISGTGERVEQVSESGIKLEDVNHLLNKSLIVWLVLIAVTYIGYFAR